MCVLRNEDFLVNSFSLMFNDAFWWINWESRFVRENIFTIFCWFDSVVLDHISLVFRHLLWVRMYLSRHVLLVSMTGYLSAASLLLAMVMGLTDTRETWLISLGFLHWNMCSSNRRLCWTPYTIRHDGVVAVVFVGENLVVCCHQPRWWMFVLLVMGSSRQKNHFLRVYLVP